MGQRDRVQSRAVFLAAFSSHPASGSLRSFILALGKEGGEQLKAAGRCLDPCLGHPYSGGQEGCELGVGMEKSVLASDPLPSRHPDLVL